MTNKPNLLYMYLGGTAGSKQDEDGALRPNSSAEEMLSVMGKKYPQYRDMFSEISSSEPIEQKDSTNMTMHDRNRVVKEILRGRENGYNTFVIQQGTDKLVNTAIYSTFHLLYKDFPVVYTGARIPFQEAKTDAIDNLYGAFAAAASGEVIGDSIFFGGKLLWGVRAVKKNGTKFDTPYYPILGCVDQDGQFYLTKKGQRVHENYKTHVRKILNLLWDEPVEVNYPNQIWDWAEALDLNEEYNPDNLDDYVRRYKAFILGGWGDGGIEETSREIEMLPKIRNWVKDDERSIWIDSRIHYTNVDMTKYAVGLQALEAGALPVFDMERDVALTKLRWAMGLSLRERAFELHPDMPTVKKLMLYNVADGIDCRFEDLKKFINVDGLKIREDEFIDILTKHRNYGSFPLDAKTKAYVDIDKRTAALKAAQLVYELLKSDTDLPAAEYDRITASSDRIIETYLPRLGEKEREAKRHDEDESLSAKRHDEDESLSAKRHDEDESLSAKRQAEDEKKPSILIVEDSPDTVKYMEIDFKRKGFNVYTAIDGKSALDIYERTHLDFVLSDVMMDGMTGPELLEKMEKHNPAPKVFLMTSNREISIELKRRGRKVFDKPEELMNAPDEILRYYKL